MASRAGSCGRIFTIRLFKDKFLNSIPGQVWGWMRGVRFLKDGENVDIILDRLLEGNNEISLSQAREEEKSAVYVSRERQALGYFWIVPVALLAGLMLLAGIIGSRLVRRARGSNNANTMDMDRLVRILSKVFSSADSARECARKLLVLRELSGIFVLSKLIPKQEKRNTLYKYLLTSGFSDAEVNSVTALFDKGKLSFEEEHIDPRSVKISPEITDQKTAKDVITSAVSKGYPKALVIDLLLTNGLISHDEVAQSIDRQLRRIGASNTQALVWDAVEKELVNLAQNKVLAQISNGNPAVDLVQKLPPTPEGRVLQYILKEGIFAQQEVLDFAQSRKNISMVEFVQELIKEKIQRPVFNYILSAIYDGVITDNDVKEKAFYTVFARVYKAIAQHPCLLKQIKNKAIKDMDIEHNPYPLYKNVQAKTMGS